MSPYSVYFCLPLIVPIGRNRSPSFLQMSGPCFAGPVGAATVAPPPPSAPNRTSASCRGWAASCAHSLLARHTDRPLPRRRIRRVAAPQASARFVLGRSPPPGSALSLFVLHRGEGLRLVCSLGEGHQPGEAPYQHHDEAEHRLTKYHMV